jgi:hypothetical protein
VRVDKSGIERIADPEGTAVALCDVPIPVESLESIEQFSQVGMVLDVSGCIRTTVYPWVRFSRFRLSASNGATRCN